MSRIIDLFTLIASAPSASGGPVDGPSREGVWALFWIMTILLALLVLGLAVISVLRWSRFRSKVSTSDQPTPHVDAWAEAGRRATTGDEPKRKQRPR